MAKGKKTGGRTKGIPNKLSGDLKSMILEALDRAGGVAYIEEVAREDKKAFCALLGRVIPTQVTGEDGGAVQMKVLIGWQSPDEQKSSR